MNNYQLKVFSGNANEKFAKAICDNLGIDLGKIVLEKFSDGEINTVLNETVRGCDVFIVQPTCKPVNDHLMELLIMIDAAKRARSEERRVGKV